MKASLRRLLPAGLRSAVRQVTRGATEPVWRAYGRHLFERDVVNGNEDAKLARNGLDKGAGVARLNDALGSLGEAPFDQERHSVHWLLASALSHRGIPAPRILEIGTYQGEFTALLTRLFPDGDIVTVDLPDDHPAVRATYRRADPQAFEIFRRERDARLRSPHVTFVQSDSFFLPAVVNGPFDVIWVDGWHFYPIVAWDLCNAYHLLREGGALLCDDVLKLDRRYVSGYVSSESFEALEYMAMCTGNEVEYFLKRRDPARYAQRSGHRYVSLLRKVSRS